MMDTDALDRVVALGVRLAARTLTDQTMTRSGTVMAKTRGQLLVEFAQLEQVEEVLDLLRWYGEWGRTRHAIHVELVRRAQSES